MKVIRIDQSLAAAPTGRSEPELALVPPARPGDRARQLMLEARTASVEHLMELGAAISAVRSLAETVVESGDVYGVGLRDFATRLGEDMLWRGKSLQALTERQRLGLLSH
jgi:hypothetical protein